MTAEAEVLDAAARTVASLHFDAHLPVGTDYAKTKEIQDARARVSGKLREAMLAVEEAHQGFAELQRMTEWIERR
jgi:hypothetical protein